MGNAPGQPHARLLPNVPNRVGEILVRAGLLTPDQADAIARLREERDERFGTIAVELGYISAEELHDALSTQFASSGRLERGLLHPDIVVHHRPRSPRAEDYRSLRSALNLRWFKHPEGARTLAVISTDRGDGRSTTAANLAVCFAEAGLRTLLIDADMHNPRQHALFGLDDRFGLAGYLSGRVEEAAYYPIGGLRTLTVIPVGGVPPNPQELLLGPLFDNLVESAARNFDVVLFDTPASGDGNDYRSIASAARGARRAAGDAVARNTGSAERPAHQRLRGSGREAGGRDDAHRRAMTAGTAGALSRRMDDRTVATGIMLAALVVLYAPVLRGLARYFWSYDNASHTPILLAGIAYGYWCERARFDWSAGPRDRLIGWGLALIGLALHLLGRMLQFYQFETASMLPVLLAATFLIGGRRAARATLGLSLLTLFAIPIPGSIVDDLLVPLKLLLSDAVVMLLGLAGYPVAQNGVVISIGFYDVQIADACAGLRSLVSLIAIGLLSLYFNPPASRATGALLVVLIAPIALLANFLRVLSVTLVTYHFRGAVGETFHDAAAYAEIVVALLLFLLVQHLLERPVRLRRASA